VPKASKNPAWKADALAQPGIASHIAKEIISNQARIINELGEEPIAVYRLLSSEFAKGGVDKNPLFQFVFRSYYRLDNAGLTPAFKARYFELMENARVTEVIDLQAIATDLYRFKSLRDRKTLQFSFITKLAATVSPHYPIYDREVGKALGFSPPDQLRDFDKRLGIYLQFYGWLRRLYTDFIAARTLRSAEAALVAKYSTAKHVPPMKALDFLFWSAGKLEVVAVPP
jgi:hypothetical protein